MTRQELHQAKIMIDELDELRNFLEKMSIYDNQNIHLGISGTTTVTYIHKEVARSWLGNRLAEVEASLRSLGVEV